MRGETIAMADERPEDPISDRLSDLGAGATYQSTFLDVKRAARV